MNCIGVICEYNPFHNGHRYHLEEASHRADTPNIIAVMSGNYVQRAEPAVTDKWRRTAMALQGGASVVIEIPTCYSTSGSEFYAGAGIRLLDRTGVCTHISFGVETENPSLIQEISNIVFQEPEEYTSLLKIYMKEGIGYAAARAKALSRLTSIDPKLLRSPNFILAVEYYKAMARYGSRLIPLPIQRLGSYHNPSLSSDLPSATAIRHALMHNEDYKSAVPDSTARLLTPGTLAAPLDAWSLELFYRLCSHTPESLRKIQDVSEGLENRLLRCIDHPQRISVLVDLLSTKRYPRSRIRRILLHILLDITGDALPPEGPPYIRVLGFRKDAQPLLSRMVSSAAVPVITNPAKQLATLPAAARAMFQQEIHCTDLYYSHVPGSSKRRGSELTQPLVILP